jgi:hypothetical protein
MAPIHTPDRNFDEFAISTPVSRDVAPTGVSLSREATNLLVETGDHGTRLRGLSIRDRGKLAKKNHQTHSEHHTEEN